MNSMVTVNEVDGLILRIKTTTTNSILTTTKNVNGKAAFIDYEATFTLTEEEGAHLVVGQSYKFQLAYYKNNQVGYYSNLAIIKCTDDIAVTISNLNSSGKSNINITHVIGKYTNADTSEKVYQYRFVLKSNTTNEIVEDTDWLNHSVYIDAGDGTSIDEYDIKYNIPVGEIYQVRYYVRTNTFKEVGSKWYMLTTKKASDSELKKALPQNVDPLSTKLNFDNAYIKVKIGGQDEKVALEHLRSAASGQTALTRAEKVLLTKLFMNDTELAEEAPMKQYYSWLEAGAVNPLNGNAINTTKRYPNETLRFMVGFGDMLVQTESQKSETDSYAMKLIKQLEEVSVSGLFILERADSSDNFTRWQKIWKKQLTELKTSQLLFTDYLIEQGVTYLYSLRQINDSDIYSARDLAPKITADYEDTFLYDGYRQLKLRLNVDVPKLSRVLSEQKKNMIGSKYPFIFRNGVIDYKEFQLKAMITAYNDNDNDACEPWETDDRIQRDAADPGKGYAEHLDPKSIFINKDTIYKQDDTYPLNDSFVFGDSASSLVAPDLIQYRDGTYNNYRANSNIDLDNSYIERIYKLEVWHWLSNGKIKFFKSSQEGCYLLRLMNVTLAPSARLGGLIHSFDSQVEEIGDVSDLEEVRYFGLLPEDDTEEIKNIQRVNTILFGPENVGTPLNGASKIMYLKISEALPGTVFTLTSKDGTKTKIMIGSTGTFELDAPDDDNYFISIEADDTEKNKALLAQKGSNNHIILIEETNDDSAFNDIVEENYETSVAHQVNMGISSNNILDSLEIKNGDTVKEEIIETIYAKFTRMDVLDAESIDELKQFAENDTAVESMVYAIPDGEGYQFYRITHLIPDDWASLHKNGDIYEYSIEQDKTAEHLQELVDDYYIIALGNELDYSVVVDYVADNGQGESNRQSTFDMTNMVETIFDISSNITGIKIGNAVLVELACTTRQNVLSNESDETVRELLSAKNAAQKDYIITKHRLVAAGEELDSSTPYIYVDPNYPSAQDVTYAEALDLNTDDLYYIGDASVDYRTINEKYAAYKIAEMEYLDAVLGGEG